MPVSISRQQFKSAFQWAATRDNDSDPETLNKITLKQAMDAFDQIDESLGTADKHVSQSEWNTWLSANEQAAEPFNIVKAALDGTTYIRTSDIDHKSAPHSKKGPSVDVQKKYSGSLFWPRSHGFYVLKKLDTVFVDAKTGFNEQIDQLSDAEALSLAHSFNKDFKNSKFPLNFHFLMMGKISIQGDHPSKNGVKANTHLTKAELYKHQEIESADDARKYVKAILAALCKSIRDLCAQQIDKLQTHTVTIHFKVNVGSFVIDIDRALKQA